MEIDFPVIGMAAMWGGLLGVFFFGGLWWTLQGISQRRHPKRFLGYSFLLRAPIALGGFWIALHHSLTAFWAAIAGFILIRFVMVQKLGAVKGANKHGH